MPISCSIYGLGVRSNVPIAGMQGLSIPPDIDVDMVLGSIPAELRQIAESEWREFFVSPELDEKGAPSLRASRWERDFTLYRIVYTDGTEVFVDGAGTRVWATWREPATVEDTATYLLGAVLGFVLRLRGVTCLHGSAIAIGDCTIALVGPSGAGKSSTAAAFALAGHRVLTDDVVALVDRGDQFLVQPAYPRIRLWPESVRSLFGQPDALPRLTPNWEKCFLDLRGPPLRFQSTAMPLAAIYFLGDRDEEKPDHGVAPISDKDAIMTLVSDTYGTRLLERPLRAREFELLGRLVKHVPLRQILPNGSLENLPGLCRKIVDDFKQLEGAPKS